MIDQATLSQFSGTENYIRWSPIFNNIYLTDGARYVAEHGGAHGAFWLMDAIASYQPNLLEKHAWARSMQFWTLEKTGERSAILSCREDSDIPPVVIQEIEFTDFDLPIISLWVAPVDETQFVIMLPSEY